MKQIDEENKKKRDELALQNGVKVQTKLIADKKSKNLPLIEGEIDPYEFVKTGDMSILTLDQIKQELSKFGMTLKNKQNKKLYERLLLEIYTYLYKGGQLPNYL